MAGKKTRKRTGAKTSAKTKRGRKWTQTRMLNLIWLLGVAFVLLLFILIGLFVRGRNRSSGETMALSSDVLSYEDTVRRYADTYGIPDYVDYLLAIMQVESGGIGGDVMQSSESLGLPPNSLDPEDSIARGCEYFAEIISDAERKGCDFDAVIQSYNFGIDYLDYVAERGGDSDLEMATAFAEWKSGGETVEYNSDLAYEVNGGWRYKYGNMFYAELVKTIVESSGSEDPIDG